MVLLPRYKTRNGGNERAPYFFVVLPPQAPATGVMNLLAIRLKKRRTSARIRKHFVLIEAYPPNSIK
jgi:hypothetical protein